METRAQYTVRLLYPSILPGTPPRCGCSASTGSRYTIPCVYVVLAGRRVIFTAFHRGFSYSDEPHAVKNIYLYIYIYDIESDYRASRPSRLQYERRVISRPGYELSLLIIYDGSNAPDYTNLTPADKNPSNRAFRFGAKSEKPKKRAEERESRVWQTRERERRKRGGRREKQKDTRCACRCVTGEILRKLTGLAFGQIIVRVSV